MGAIKGIVRDTREKALADVNLVIVAGPSHADIVAVTDARGTFEFSSLRPGHYVIKAYGPVESDDLPVRVHAQQVSFVEIWLETAPPSPQKHFTDRPNYFDEENYFAEESSD